MKKFVLSMMLAASCMTMSITPLALAQQTPAPVATTAAPATAPANEASVIALGGGIALIVVGFAGYVIARSRRRNKDRAANEPVFTAKPPAAPLKPTFAPKPVEVPAAPVFDSAAFLGHAKASFIRMQAAWDKADTNDLKQFTTPEVFAELSAQIGGRGETASVTEVVAIEAELLGVQPMGEDELASVKFTGLIKPDASAQAEPFAEVWNMSRARTAKGSWVLAGIQQLS